VEIFIVEKCTSLFCQGMETLQSFNILKHRLVKHEAYFLQSFKAKFCSKVANYLKHLAWVEMFIGRKQTSLLCQGMETLQSFSILKHRLVKHQAYFLQSFKAKFCSKVANYYI
jgi:hypothetical protein